VKVRPYLVLCFLLIAIFYGYSLAQSPKASASDACVRCHRPEQKTVTGTPHEKSSCEGCHGAGEKHQKTGGETATMFSYRRATAEEVRAQCGQCHSSPVMAKHAQGDVACTACHSLHHYIQKKNLLKPEDPEAKPV
jgi:hypothetical protein